MTLCSSVPSSAYLLDGFSGICWTSLTEPGQAMTRLAVEPPTIVECWAISEPSLVFDKPDTRQSFAVMQYLFLQREQKNA